MDRNKTQPLHRTCRSRNRVGVFITAESRKRTSNTSCPAGLSPIWMSKKTRGFGEGEGCDMSLALTVVSEVALRVEEFGAKIG